MSQLSICSVCVCGLCANKQGFATRVGFKKFGISITTKSNDILHSPIDIFDVISQEKLGLKELFACSTDN